jgi:hypothetical protein
MPVITKCNHNSTDFKRSTYVCNTRYRPCCPVGLQLAEGGRAFPDPHASNKPKHGIFRRSQKYDNCRNRSSEAVPACPRRVRHPIPRLGVGVESGGGGSYRWACDVKCDSVLYPEGNEELSTRFSQVGVRRGCLPRLHEDSGDKMGTVGIRHFFQERVDCLRKFDIFQLLNAEVILNLIIPFRFFRLLISAVREFV